ncbi:MAG TPA: hypothetical protein VNT20_12845 [Flavisolibacter sp.]|nr:hypothetical protein [Flavisolibacter sp.]
MRRITLCLMVFVCLSSKAQTLHAPLSIPYIKTNTYSSAHIDAFSLVGNQAALAALKNFSVGAYGERRFMLADLSSYCLAFGLPAASGNFGVQANYFGSASYNQSQLGLAYARNLGKVDVGAQFNYHQIKIAGYGNASAINFEAGAILHVSEQFQTGVHIYNPTRVSISKNGDEKLPIVYSFGMGYDVSDKFFIGVEIEKTEDQPINVNAGLQYAFDEKLFVRVGVASATSSFYLGVGFLWNGLRIDVAASLHPSLGVTPGMLLVYNSPARK